MVLFAISLLALLIGVGLAIDGGYGLFEYRQAQNAADFASQSAATQLLANCGGPGAVLSNSDVAAVIDDVVAKNSPSTAIPGGWTAYYLNSSGNTLTSPPSTSPIYVDTPGTDNPAPGNAPLGACGVYLTVRPQWPAFMAQVIGIARLKTAAAAAAVNAITKGVGALTSIVALGEHGAHTIFEGGSGVFNVNGTIFDNSDGFLSSSKNTWSGSHGEVDVVDGKQSGTMNVEGNIDSFVGNPFDWCFGTSGLEPNAAAPPADGTNPTPPDPPYNTATCNANATVIKYYNWSGNEHAQFTTDPLGGNPAPPTANDAYCGGLGVITNPPTSTDPLTGATIYYPGVYTAPVVVTGNAEFYNCSQTLDPTNASKYTSNAEAGMFYFDQGVALRPATGDTVTGYDVLLVTSAPIPDSAGGVFGQNVGDGEPAIGKGSGECTLTKIDEVCNNSASSGAGPDCGSEPAPNTTAGAGTNCNADGSYANNVAAQGLNDSLEIGGQGTVTLTASTGTAFPWTDFLTWQLQKDSKQTYMANVGLDSELGDSSNMTLSGIIYDNSDQTGQDITGTLTERYWDGNAGVPFLPGGMLIAGYGVAGGSYGTGFTCGSVSAGYTGGCNITINGLAVVDEFQTEGYSTFNITGSTYHIPGIKGTGAILTQ